MGKSGKGKSSKSQRKKNTRTWQGLLALVVVSGMVYALIPRDEGSATGSGGDFRAVEETSNNPLLRNRLVLPARPQNPRPYILSPASFPEPEVQRSYQVARDIPEVLEYMPCYCGCYASSGHRNNLDCFKDNHGAT